ncbi:hypothetical protein DEO72_LG5g1833 [Vigna unguiculata]|uniref:Uncharacterized protein n=1 Tax=Vigna unguiculata TaxID=3917 RepID=A0A4D6LYI8_VIGUN|nr:hypothetical protein DEO72_LG5g1833 [Vigna unguiculata]
MNLPAHGTASPDPSKTSLSIKTTHTTRDLVHGRLAHQPTPPGETGPDRLAVPAHRLAPALRNRPRPPGGTCPPPGGTCPPPGASGSTPHYFSRHRLAEHTVPPGAAQCNPPTLGLSPGGYQ